jgi:Uma2 family endonuclease
VSTLPKHYLTPEEYLELERKAERKSEYLDGAMFAMAGAGRRHALIVTNLVAELRQQLRGRSCEVYSTDLRVRVSPTGLYAYPDVVVVCGQAQFAAEDADTLLNPMLIVEVLSEATKNYDRGEKFRQYRMLQSLAEYVMVAQDAIHVEQYIKRQNSWVLTETDDRGAVIRLSSVDCQLAVADLYERIEFPAVKD